MNYEDFKVRIKLPYDFHILNSLNIHNWHITRLTEIIIKLNLNCPVISVIVLMKFKIFRKSIIENSRIVSDYPILVK